MKTKRYFPMFIDLSDKKIVVVGGGNIATEEYGHFYSLPEILLQLHRNARWNFRNSERPDMLI